MNTLIPNRYLFDLEFPLAYRAQPPALDGSLSGWTDGELLPRLGAVDGKVDFAEVWACWNGEGLYVACRVEGKNRPPRCDPKTYWQSDHLRLCTDMRDARDIKRATRYCQQFYFMPAGGGPSASGGSGAGARRTPATRSARRGAAMDGTPAAGAVKFQRAREHAPPVPAGSIRIASNVWPAGWQIEAHVAAAALNGFDPTEHPRIGFYTIVEDHELGQQCLTVGDDLFWYIDPSTWATAVLRRGS